MRPNNQNDYSHHLKVRILFGLFEADATGAVAIGGALLFVVLTGVGRWWGLW